MATYDLSGFDPFAPVPPSSQGSITSTTEIPNTSASLATISSFHGTASVVLGFVIAVVYWLIIKRIFSKKGRPSFIARGLFVPSILVGGYAFGPHVAQSLTSSIFGISPSPVMSLGSTFQGWVALSIAGAALSLPVTLFLTRRRNKSSDRPGVIYVANEEERRRTIEYYQKVHENRGTPIPEIEIREELTDNEEQTTAKRPKHEINKQESVLRENIECRGTQLSGVTSLSKETQPDQSLPITVAPKAKSRFKTPARRLAVIISSLFTVWTVFIFIVSIANLGFLEFTNALFESLGELFDGGQDYDSLFFIVPLLISILGWLFAFGFFDPDNNSLLREVQRLVKWVKTGE